LHRRQQQQLNALTCKVSEPQHESRQESSQRTAFRKVKRVTWLLQL
jgi:hypothetical protein